MKRGFFLGCNTTLWRNVINALDDCEFVYVSGERAQLDVLHDQGGILHDDEQAERGILPPAFSANTQIALDEVILARFRQTELNTLGIASRMDRGYTFSLEERRRLYYRWLEAWLNAVANLKPDFVFFPVTPHSVYDYVLYGVCLEQGIPIVCFRNITALGLVLPFPYFDQPNERIASNYQALLQRDPQLDALMTDLSERTVKYLGSHSKDYHEAMPEYLRRRLDSESRRGAIRVDSPLRWFFSRLLRLHRIPRYARSLVRLIVHYARSLIRFFNDAPPKNFLKHAYENLEDSHLSGIQWRRYKVWAKRYKSSLRRAYDGLTMEPEFQVDYVYVALQYQPERTSQPEGGRFADQWLMVRMLAAQLPEGWRIIIKENPTQLLPGTSHGERGRLPGFYQDLLNAGNVQLVPITTSQFDLIDNARAVVTLNGTPGFEAVLRGVPAFTFGHAWYRGCDGVFLTSDRNKLAAAIEAVASGYKPDRHKVLMFLRAVEQSGVHGYFSRRHASNFDVENEAFAREIAVLAREMIQENDPGK